MEVTRVSAAKAMALATATSVIVKPVLVFLLATAVVYCAAVKVFGDAKVRPLTLASSAIVAALPAATSVTLTLTLAPRESRIFANLVAS